MGSDFDDILRKGPNCAGRNLRSQSKVRGTVLTPPHYSTRSTIEHIRQHSEPAPTFVRKSSRRTSTPDNTGKKRIHGSVFSHSVSSRSPNKRLRNDGSSGDQLFSDIIQEEADEFPEGLFGGSEQSTESLKSNFSLSIGKKAKKIEPPKETLKKTANQAYLPLNCSEIMPSRPNIIVPETAIIPTLTLSATLGDVGGLDYQITKVKESFVLPMLYPKFCESYSITTSRGILFHGPPGTGKTLLARALAHECSDNSLPIGFFHFTSADILSKWVGEAETRIQAIFEAARLWQPSLVFFDEIDGLAPARIENDRPSASLVSALLAAIDGFSNLGRVLVVGSTNRLDAIDPALRRPGRFDQELFFPLPSEAARISILKINTKLWPQSLPEELFDHLASQTSGFCGADLALLCSKASKHAFNRQVPGALDSPNFHRNPQTIKASSILVEPEDFLACLPKVKPSSLPSINAGLVSISSPYSTLLSPIVEKVKNCFKAPSSLRIAHIFPPITVIEGKYPVSRHSIVSAAVQALDSIKVVFIDIPSVTTTDDTTGSKELSRLLNLLPNNQSELFTFLDPVAFFAYNPAFINLVRQALLRSSPDGKRGFLFSCPSASDLNPVLSGIRGNCINSDFPQPGTNSLFFDSLLDEFNFEDSTDRQSCIETLLDTLEGRPIDHIFQFCDMLATNGCESFTSVWERIAFLASSFNPIGPNEIDIVEF